MADRKNYFLLFDASAENCTVLPFATENNDFHVCFYYSAGDSRNKVINVQVGLLLCNSLSTK